MMLLLLLFESLIFHSLSSVVDVYAVGLTPTMKRTCNFRSEREEKKNDTLMIFRKHFDEVLHLNLETLFQSDSGN